MQIYRMNYIFARQQNEIGKNVFKLFNDGLLLFSLMTKIINQTNSYSYLRLNMPLFLIRFTEFIVDHYYHAIIFRLLLISGPK